MNLSLMGDEERAAYLESERNRYYERFLENYNNIVRQGPTVVCNYCCGRLWFADRVKKLDFNAIEEKYTLEFANKVFALSFRSEYMDNIAANIYKFCSTCHRNMN